MKKISLLSALTISTMLTACGGGGGGHGNIPNTTLPDIPNQPSVTQDSITTMNYSVSNADDRIAYAENMLGDAFDEEPVSQVSMFMLRRAPQNDKKSKADRAYENMRDVATDDVFEAIVHDDFDTDEVNQKKIRQALKLAGVKDALEKAWDDLKNFILNNKEHIKAQADDIFNRYGVEQEFDISNAKLALGTSEPSEYYVNFNLDDNDKIASIDVHADHGGNYKRKNDKDEFEGTSKYYQYAIRVGSDCTKGACAPEQGTALVFESKEKLTDINKIKEGLLAKLEEEIRSNSFNGLHGGTNNGAFQEGDVEKLIDSTKNMINNLTIEDFNRTDMDNTKVDHPYYNELTYTDNFIYHSYGKELKLAYSDFGLLDINTKEINSSRPEGSNEENIKENAVFAGGYDAKKLNPQGTMTFKGRAVGAVDFREQDNWIENSNVVDKNISLDGEATLNFDNGNETLKAEFDNWYDVTVQKDGNSQQANLILTNGNKIVDDDFKYRGNNEYTVNDFLGEQMIKAEGNEHIVVNDHNNMTGSSSGNLNIGYYGEDLTPSEATGFVIYEESFPITANDGSTERLKSLTTQFGFGAVKQ